MVAGFLFTDGSGNTISWLVLPRLRLEWDVIGTHSWGSAALAWLYHALCDGCLRIGRNTNLGGCAYLLQVWMWECFTVARLFRLDPQVLIYLLFLLCILYVNRSIMTLKSAQRLAFCCNCIGPIDVHNPSHHRLLQQPLCHVVPVEEGSVRKHLYEYQLPTSLKARSSRRRATRTSMCT
jgi:hypothetical protein